MVMVMVMVMDVEALIPFLWSLYLSMPSFQSIWLMGHNISTQLSW